MNTINNHIARLGIQSTKFLRDGDVFASAEQELQAGGKDTIDAILSFVTANSDGTTYVTLDNKKITISKKLICVGAAMALTLCGWSAKPYLQSLIIDQPNSLIRTEMIKEIQRLGQDWTTVALQDIIAQLDSITADYVRKLVGTPTKAMAPSPPTTSSGMDIDRWISDLENADQCKNALNFLTHNMTILKLNANKDKREQAATHAFPLIQKLNDLQSRMKAAQLVYRYSPDIDRWLDAMAWCEAHFNNASLPDGERLKILDMMYTDLSHHPYAVDAKELLKSSLFDFIKKNDTYNLEVAAIKILIINKLPQPPAHYLIRNKATNEQATLICAECSKKIKPGAAISVSLLNGIHFCSRECSTSYIMREKGSMNPRYW